jgi:hypothetical protein
MIIFQSIPYTIFCTIFSKNVKNRIAHNVPAVYDVFAARIRACVVRPGLQKCGWSEPWEWSVVE